MKFSWLRIEQAHTEAVLVVAIMTLMIIVQQPGLLQVAQAHTTQQDSVQSDFKGAVKSDGAVNVRSLPAPNSQTPSSNMPWRKPSPAPDVKISPSGFPTSQVGSTNVFFGFQGLSQSGFVPPDVALAAGTNDVVEMVNLALRITTKQGVIRTSSGSLAALFGTGSDCISDPKVIFDSVNIRWYSSLVDCTDNTIRFVISQTGDPTGSWNRFTFFLSFLGANLCPDQPKIGDSSDKLLLTSNDFTSCQGLGFQIATVWAVFDKSTFLAGFTGSFTCNTTGSICNFGTDSRPPIPSFMAMQTEGLSNAYVTWKQNTILGIGGPSICLLAIVGVPPSATTGSQFCPGSNAGGSPPAADQPGSPASLDTGDDRVQTALAFSFNPSVSSLPGFVWLGFNDGCKPPGDTTTRPCFHLVELSCGTSTCGIFQEFDVGRAGSGLFYPALSVDSSFNLDVLFGFSDSFTSPTLVAAGQVSGQPFTFTPFVFLSTIAVSSADATISNGGVCPPSCPARYGDYFGAATDPSNPALVWAAGEYQPSSSWSSFIFLLQTGNPIPAHTTVLNLNPVLNVFAGQPITISGQLTDASAFGVGPTWPTACTTTCTYGGFSGFGLSYSGTGTFGRMFGNDIPTGLKGTFSFTAQLPDDSCGTGFTLQAHYPGFTGNGITYLAADSNIVTFSVLCHPTTTAMALSYALTATGVSIILTATVTDTSGILTNPASGKQFTPTGSVTYSDGGAGGAFFCAIQPCFLLVCFPSGCIITPLEPPSGCNLGPTSNIPVASCGPSESYTPLCSATGPLTVTVNITATYPGDLSHSGSSSTIVLTAFCSIQGGSGGEHHG